MLDLFRKAKKAYVALITIMLLLPVQQSFAQDSSQFVFNNSNTTISAQATSSMSDMGPCPQMSTEQQGDCCNDDVCDSSKCSTATSFVALLFNHDLNNVYDNQQHESSIIQREFAVLPSKLFRPPRKIQS